MRRHLRLVLVLSIALAAGAVLLAAAGGPLSGHGPRDVYACAGGHGQIGDWCQPTTPAP